MFQGEGRSEVPDAPHTLSIFDDDLDQLRAMVSEMGGRVEASIHESVTALVRGDEERAQVVVAGDSKVDRLAAEIERHGLRMIALRMPLAGDLRDVLAALKIAMLVARMGDCAKEIAHRAALVGACRSCAPVKLVRSMEVEVSAMVKAALDAFVHRKVEPTIEVSERDAAVDDFHACIWRELITHMQERPEDIDGAAHMMFVSHMLERIGDDAAAVARFVHFAVTGEDMPPEAGRDPPIGAAGRA